MSMFLGIPRISCHKRNLILNRKLWVINSYRNLIISIGLYSSRTTIPLKSNLWGGKYSALSIENPESVWPSQCLTYGYTARPFQHGNLLKDTCTGQAIAMTVFSMQTHKHTWQKYSCRYFFWDKGADYGKSSQEILGPQFPGFNPTMSAAVKQMTLSAEDQWEKPETKETSQVGLSRWVFLSFFQVNILKNNNYN